MSDQPLTYEILRSAIVGRNREHLRLVNARIHRVVAAMLGKHSPDVRDVAQSAMLKVLRGFSALHPAQEHGTAAGWVNMVARNETLTHCRTKKRYKKIFCDEEDADAEYHGVYDPSSFELTVNKELLLEAIDALDVAFRTVLVLSRFHGRSIKEIAQELEIKEGTVKSRLFRAESKLREYIDSYKPTFLIDNSLLHDPTTKRFS